jgi:hypothetical protein
LKVKTLFLLANCFLLGLTRVNTVFLVVNYPLVFLIVSLYGDTYDWRAPKPVAITEFKKPKVY